jgi:hypothetical protein
MSRLKREIKLGIVNKKTEPTRPKIKYRFSLSIEARDELKGIVAKGKHNSQKVLNH